MFDDRPKLIDNMVEAIDSIDICSVKEFEVPDSIFDELLLLFAFRGDNEFGRLDNLLTNGYIYQKWCMIR